MTAAYSFADMLAQFLTIYLPVTRACSPNTISAYRDAFTLFLRFMDHQQATSPDKVSFADFTTSNVAAFVGWLRTDRQCSTATANQRLAALKSFFRYVQAQAPEQITQARQVLDVKAGQTPQPTIGYLSVEAIGLLLEHARRRGPRDVALLTTLYDTAARVQEVCDLSIGDLHLGKPASATLTGKVSLATSMGPPCCHKVGTTSGVLGPVGVIVPGRSSGVNRGDQLGCCGGRDPVVRGQPGGSAATGGAAGQPEPAAGRRRAAGLGRCGCRVGRVVQGMAITLSPRSCTIGTG